MAVERGASRRAEQVVSVATVSPVGASTTPAARGGLNSLRPPLGYGKPARGSWPGPRPQGRVRPALATGPQPRAGRRLFPSTPAPRVELCPSVDCTGLDTPPHPGTPQPVPSAGASSTSNPLLPAPIASTVFAKHPDAADLSLRYLAPGASEYLYSILSLDQGLGGGLQGIRKALIGAGGGTVPGDRGPVYVRPWRSRGGGRR
jgi:hypothetical protein